MGYDTFEVTVPDGTLHVGRWGSGPKAILALHGITANHRSMHALADALGDGFTVLAPDQRGRGRSRDVGPGYTMADHADDAAAILDTAAVDRALVVGHSMGGFVGIVFADRHAGRVERLLLVDGGIPLDLGAAVNLPTEQLIAAVIGPAAERLKMTFASADAYREYWRVHPAFIPWNPYLEEHVDYDLVPIDGELRPSCRIEAMIGSTESQIQRDDIPKALDHLRVPTMLLRAPRGIMSDAPLYAEGYLDQWASTLPGFSWTSLEDVNHYTALVGESGARQVAEVIRARSAPAAR